MPRLALAAPWLLSFLILGASAGAAPKKIHRSAARCVRYSQKADEGAGGMAMRLRNRCRFEVACTVEWRVRCDGESGGELESASLSLARGEAGSVAASAARCDGDWEVADVRWSCDPVEPRTAAP